MLGFGRSAAVVVLATFVAGCSASNFKQPVIAFSAATKTAAASFNEFDLAYGKAVYDKNIAKVLANRQSLHPRRGECLPGAAQCRLVVSLQNQQEQELFSASESLGKILMGGIVIYAGNLEKIVTADDAGDIKTAVDATKTNLVNLARATDALAKVLNRPTSNLEAKITPFAAPIADAASFALSKYGEAVKLQALRQSTDMMNEILPAMTQIFKFYGDFALEVKRDQAGAAFRKAQLAYALGPATQAKVEAVLTAAKDYDNALQAKPEVVFTALMEAHAALAEALRNPEIGFDKVGPYLQQLAAEAEKLVAITKALQKAGKSKKAGGTTI